MSMLRKRMILFLSTGDTCRSPMAAIYMRHLLEEHGVHNVEVRTAGVSTIVGLLASQETIQVMKSEGLDASKHRSNQLSPVALRRANIIFGMTPFHVQRALRMMPEARGKVHLLKEYAKTDLSKVQIDDPMGGTLEIYRKCFEEIREALETLIYMPKAVGRELKPEERKPKPKPAETPKAETAPETPAKAAEPKPKAAAPKKKAAAKPAAKKKTAPKKTVKEKAAKKTTKKKAAKKKTASKKAPKRAAKKKAATKKAAKRTTKPAAKKKTTKKAAKKTAKKKTSKKAAKKKATKKTAPKRRR